MRLAQERVLPKGHTLPGQDRTRFARFVGQTGRPWLSRKFPSSVAGTASPRMQLLGHPFPSLHPTLGACTGAFTPTPQSPGQVSREGGAHLCSRSPHLCLPGWWTQAFATLGTAEAGLVPGLRDRSRAWSHPRDRAARLWYQPGSLLCF